MRQDLRGEDGAMVLSLRSLESRPAARIEQRLKAGTYRAGKFRLCPVYPVGRYTRGPHRYSSKCSHGSARWSLREVQITIDPRPGFGTRMAP